MRHLILNLESPLMAFGGETIDNLGVIRPFPAVSMLTGLFANALGWRRVERDLHQRLQDRIVFAARIDREPAGGIHMTDFQSAAITNRDRGWTTRGAPEGRGGGTYTNWLRYRDYYADMRVTVALRLDPTGDAPTLDALADALDEPRRPLFIGRKPCLPSVRLSGGFADGDTALDALLKAPLCKKGVKEGSSIRLAWPESESVERLRPSRSYMITDQRNWTSGLHGGGRAVCDGSLPATEFPSPADESN